MFVVQRKQIKVDAFNFEYLLQIIESCLGQDTFNSTDKEWVERAINTYKTLKDKRWERNIYFKCYKKEQFNNPIESNKFYKKYIEINHEIQLIIDRNIDWYL